MKFTIYQESTGEVLFAGTADNPSALVQEGQVLCLGKIFESGYFKDGEHFPLPDAPSWYHVFDYSIKQWVDPRTDETQWTLVRSERNRLLSQSDWTQLPDVPLATKEVWAVYRQGLRDITLQADPFNIVWPVAPQ